MTKCFRGSVFYTTFSIPLSNVEIDALRLKYNVFDTIYLIQLKGFHVLLSAMKIHVTGGM